MSNEEKIKVLCVDDNKHNLVAMEAVFYSTPYQLVEAHSGFEALAILERDPDFALVLLDVQMPEMDGFETAMKIKLIKGYEDIPIIFITAHYREDPYVKKGYEAGAVDYFGKPFDPELLKMKVNLYASFRHKAILLREREKRIRETEELLKAGKKLTDIFEHLTVGVLISDKEGNIIQCNELASRILNAREAEIDDHYGEILSWWNGNGVTLKNEGILHAALEEGKSAHNKCLAIECPDGEEKSILASVTPLVAAGKEIVGAVVILQDMTSTRKIEEEFEEKISRLISLSVDLEHNPLITRPS